MNPGPTEQRVRETLKRRIMEGLYPPGARLDAASLSDTLAASATPVREALHQLAGEGLIETRTGSGFHLPFWDEPGLVDLLSWNEQVLLAALKKRQAAPQKSSITDCEFDTLADEAAAAFLEIARGSSNREHARAVAQLNDRLHMVREIEPEIVEGAASELKELRHLLSLGELSALRRSCAAYHRRRRHAAAAIVRRLHRLDQ